MKCHAVLLCVLLTTAYGSARAQVPLPADLSIEAPGTDVPAADAAFSGAWGNGAWDGFRPNALIVEQIAADGTARLVYALGASEYPKLSAKWLRTEGHIEDRRLTFDVSDPESTAGYRIEYRIVAPGRLEGNATNWDGWRSHVFLQRISGRPAAIVATAALPVQPVWRDIRIPEHSTVGAAAGQTIELQATLYRTRLPWRQPLVILNHGAGVPVLATLPAVKRIYRFEAEARFFLARGYSVVVPMRKGRGRSGGPFLEPLGLGIPMATQLDSGVEDVDAVVNAMRAEAWVDPARIIVAGWSHGGFLSVIYAARHPDKVAGVINFSGSWWSEWDQGAERDRPYLAAAGKTAHVPELWLYAYNDMYSSLPYARKNFDAFRADGGTGDFVAFGTIHGVPHNVIGQGHALFEHVGMWKATVAAYLRRIDGG